MKRFLACILLLTAVVMPVRANQDSRYVALTFDDGPSGKFTRSLLDGLALRGVKATFLLCGYRMEQYPDITRRIFDEGHEIGYHGFSHKSMQDMSRKTIGQELIDSGLLLPAGCRPVFFRPPGGIVTDGVRQVAEARQLALLSWSVDPKDWATTSVGSIETAVLKKIQDGDIILLHDMSASSVQAALDIVDTLQGQGYRFVTVSELAKLRNVSIRPGRMYERFPPKEETVK